MQIKIIFFSYDAENSPYLDSYFLPLLDGMNRPIAQYFIGQITSGNFNSSGSSTQQENVQGRKIVKIGRGKNIMTLLRALLCLKSYVKQENTKEYLVIYRSIGGALIYLFMKVHGIKFKATIYDSDGLAIDERIETGAWKRFEGRSVIARAIECFGINAASKILVRSSKTISNIESRRSTLGKKYFCVLNNGRNTEMFAPGTNVVRHKIRATMGFSESDFILIYAGTIGNQYLVPEMIKVFEMIKIYVEKSKFVFLTHAQDDVIEAFLGTEESRKVNDIHVVRVEPPLVGRTMCIGDVGLSLRWALPSMNHVAPLKYREYLLSGVPVIYSGNTADSGVNSSNIACELNPDMSSSYLEVATWVSEKLLKNREEFRVLSRNYGLKNFDILTDSIKLSKFLSEN